MKPYVACGNCEYYSAPGKPQGSCRANPPTMLPVALSGGLAGFPTPAREQSGWPGVRSADWCGQFKMDPARCPLKGMREGDTIMQCDACGGIHAEAHDAH